MHKFPKTNHWIVIEEFREISQIQEGMVDMDKVKKQRWVVGLIFIAGAITWFAVGMGWLNFKISMTTIILTIVLAIILLSSLVNFNIPASVFSLAFLAMLYAGPLGITNLVPWTILGIALLVSMGLMIIFAPQVKQYHLSDWQKSIKNSFTGNTTSDDDSKQDSSNQSHPVIDAKMGGVVRSVKSDDFQQADIKGSMSSTKVDFDQALIQGDSATINFDVYMCEVQVLIPKDWKIINEVRQNMGNVTFFNDDAPHGGPVVRLTGKMNLGSLEVRYIEK